MVRGSSWVTLETHHGLVDKAAALELGGAVSVVGVGPRVFGHGPFLLGDVQVHQLVFLGRLAVHRPGGHVRRHQLATGTSEGQAEQKETWPLLELEAILEVALEAILETILDLGKLQESSRCTLWFWNRDTHFPPIILLNSMIGGK